MNNKTQQYINKYCEYIDRFLDYWKNGGDKSKIRKIVYKAEFIHFILGIDKKISRFSGRLINPNIGEFYYNLEDYKHDPDFTRRTIEQTALRESHILECKAFAKKINKIDDVESGAYESNNITAQKLTDLLFSLKQIKKTVNARTVIDPGEGENANHLAIEMGLISKWLPLAIETRLAKGIKMPYLKNETIGNTFSLDGKAYYPESFKDNVNKWIDKTEKLLSKPHTTPQITISPIVEPIIIDEEKQLAYDGVEWYRITPKALEILQKLNQKPGVGLTGDQLKTIAGSEESPHKTIKTLPEKIRARIKNRRGFGYHLV